MKKIAYILTTYPCPSETFVRREISQLRRQNCDISIFAASGCVEEPGEKQHTNVTVRPSSFSFCAVWSVFLVMVRHPVRMAKLILLIVRFLCTCPKDGIMLLVNVHTVCVFSRIMQNRQIEHIHACFLSWPACLACGISVLTQLPYSLAAHARDIFVEGGAVRLKVQKAQFVTCCTWQGLEYLKRNLDNACHSKLFMNYHGIEPEKILKGARPLKTDMSKGIIAVGRLVEKKGFIHLLKAFGQILPKHPEAVLAIVGDGPQKGHLIHTAEQLGIRNHVYLTGWVEHSLTLELIARSKMLIVPSVIAEDGDRDGLPNVVLEAFSVNTPVIANHLTGITEAVINEKTGLLVNPGDSAQLANAIERLFSDSQLCSFLTSNASKMLSNSFNLEKNCFALAKLFETEKCLKHKIKIAHIIEGFVGGTSTYLCNILPELAKAGFDVMLICSLKRSDCEAIRKIDQLRKQGVQIRIIPMTRAINPLSDLYSFCILTMILIKEQFDIIHTHCSKAGALGRIAGRLIGIRTIYHSAHCFAFLRCGSVLTKKIYCWAERHLAGFTSAFIAVSVSEADSAKNWKIFDNKRCIVVNNGLPEKLNCQPKNEGSPFNIKEYFSLPPNSFIIATACRLVEYKGIFTFIETAVLAKSNAVFVIAGDGPLREKAERYISCNQLTERVKLLGHVSEMNNLYTICDMVVLCSQMEAQPYSILEAMRAKRPIIASRVPGNIELLENDRGLLVPTDPTTLAKAIDYLLDDKPKRSQLARNAYAYFRDKHLLRDQVQKLADIYNENKAKERNSSGASICAETICLQ